LNSLKNQNAKEESITSSNKHLKENDFLVLTLGSAFVYKLTDDQNTFVNSNGTNHLIDLTIKDLQIDKTELSYINGIWIL